MVFFEKTVRFERLEKISNLNKFVTIINLSWVELLSKLISVHHCSLHCSEIVARNLTINPNLSQRRLGMPNRRHVSLAESLILPTNK